MMKQRDEAAGEGPKKAPLARLRPVFARALDYRGLVGAALLALVIAAAANISAIATLQPVIDHGFAGGDPGSVDVYFMRLFAIVIVLALASALRAYFVTLLGERVVADLRCAAHASVIDLEPAFFEENRPAEIVSRLTADAAIIQQAVGVSVSIALRNVLLFFGALTMMVIYNPALMATITLAMPLIIAPIIVLGRRVRHLSRSSQDRIADVAAMASESLSAIAVVQAFTREDEDRRRFRAAVERAYATAKARIRARSWLAGLVVLLISGAIIFILWRGAHEVVAGSMSGGEMAAFVGFAIMASAAAGAVVEVYGELQRAAGAAGRLSELLRARGAIRSPAQPRPLPLPVRGEIRFEKVKFAYPSKPDIAALHEVSLEIGAGETVALVGPSGAGKSTLLQLLLRFFDPQAGRISLDGIDIRELDLQHFRKNLAVVQQDTVIFADTVRENIRYGRLEADDGEVEAAARAAAADGFIAELPQGYDSHLGERGVRLSGGQRQRIAIARAILRDAPVLLLDEATSALDAGSEQAVQQALGRLMEGRTTIVIAHRLATVMHADRIVVLDHGRLVAEGSHDVLIRGNALYRRLAKLQFSETTKRT